MIRLAGVGLLVALRTIGPGTSASHPMASAGNDDPPPVSVVLITLDTVRADHLGCYGYPQAETPALDALARESVRFANAYTVVPITLPSHAVILTGTYPMWNGVRDFTSPGLPAGIPTLAEIMRRHAYATAAFVSAFVLNSMWGLNRGFDLYDDQMKPDPGSAADPMLATRPGDVTTSRMLAWLDQHPQKRFFVWLHLYDAHSPYRAPEPYRSRHPGRPYDAAIAFDDAQSRRRREKHAVGVGSLRGAVRDQIPVGGVERLVDAVQIRFAVGHARDVRTRGRACGRRGFTSAAARSLREGGERDREHRDAANSDSARQRS